MIDIKRFDSTIPSRIKHYLEVVYFIVVVTGIISTVMVIRNAEVTVKLAPRVEVVEIHSPVASN